MRVLRPTAALPKAVEKAEILTELFFLETAAEVIGPPLVPGVVFKKLDQAGVFLPLFGRDADTWDEYIEVQLERKNICRVDANIVLTPRGSSRLEQLKREAVGIELEPATT